MPVIAAGTVVLGDRVCRPGWLSVTDGRIADCGAGPPPVAPDVDLGAAVVVPGFVDIHVHGGAGGGYADSPPISTAPRRCTPDTAPPADWPAW